MIEKWTIKNETVMENDFLGKQLHVKAKHIFAWWEP